MTIEQVLQELILDVQRQPPAPGVPRRLQPEPVPGKATVVVGVRRCGKSTLLYQIMDRLAARGVSRESFLYVNLFDDRLHPLLSGGLAPVVDAYYTLYPERKGRETAYVFLDEIQMAQDWEPFVDRLLRTEKCEVYLSGSSSRMLSQELATQMRGRSLAWELFPFSFTEYLDAKGLSVRPRGSADRLHVRKAFSEYWRVGGFPEVHALNDRLRVMVHQEYFKTIVHRDVTERHDIAHPRAVVDLAHRLLGNVGSLCSLNALTGYLKSLSHKTHKTAVGEWLGWLEDAYFLFTIKLFDPSLARQNANPRKVYCVDHALVPSVTAGILPNTGHLLENLVFLHLRRQTPALHYYRTGSGREVDFAWRRADGQLELIQVCETLAAPTTRKRELAALTEALREQPGAAGMIVTMDETTQADADAAPVEIVPAWQFLLREGA